MFLPKRYLHWAIPPMVFVFTLGLFGILPYGWIIMLISGWAAVGTLLVVGDMHKDWYWRFDRKLGEAIWYTRRAPHLKNLQIPMLWSRTGEIRRIKFETITDVLLEDRRTYGFPEYRIMLILDGPIDDDRNKLPLIWAYHPDKHIIDWAEKLRATVHGGSLQV